MGQGLLLECCLLPLAFSSIDCSKEEIAQSVARPRLLIVNIPRLTSNFVWELSAFLGIPFQGIACKNVAKITSEADTAVVAVNASQKNYVPMFSWMRLLTYT